MALDSMFFERVLGEVGRVLDRIEKEGVPEEVEIAYQEGKVFLCYQIYRQNIYNPKLLEISEARIAKIKELRDSWKQADEAKQPDKKQSEDKKPARGRPKKAQEK